MSLKSVKSKFENQVQKKIKLVRYDHECKYYGIYDEGCQFMGPPASYLQDCEVAA